MVFSTRKRTQDQPYLITTSSIVPKGSFSAPTFDTFLVEQQPEVAERSGRAQGEGGLSKKFRSFPWTSKKQPALSIATNSSLAPPRSPGLSAPASPTSIYSPTSPESPGQDSIRHSTLAAFPAPPISSAPRPHASAFIAPHVAVSASQSASTVSTFKSSSSFASSNLFHNTDEWESGSEATSMSIASSPESSSRDSSGESKQQRMWRVKGLNAESPIKRGLQDGGLKVVEEEDETESRRNSTPVPRMVAMMLADPETPPRPKRFSASSTKPSPTSPPLDLDYERKVRAARVTPPGSPESSRDADDEDDSPTQGKIAARLLSSSDSLGANLGPKTRIPSICFEGISMDAVFAQVEKNLKGSPKAATRDQKAARRRTRVLSLYKPAPFGDAIGERRPDGIEEESTPLSPVDSVTLSPSPSELDALRCASTTPTPLQPMETARPRPYPRRTSSRPAPLDVEAANAFPTLASLGSAASLTSITSPSLRGSYSPAPNRAAPIDLFSPTSPTYTLAPSPVLPSPKSPAFEASTPRFVESLAHPPSPAPLPTTPVRASPVIPEVCIFPPTLDDEDCDWQAPIDQNAQPGPTRVVMLPPKRIVRASTRAAPKKAGERKPIVVRPLQEKENYTPPPSPALSTTSTIHCTPTRNSTIDSRRLSSNSPLTIRRHSSDVDSDVEETLQNLLNRLNRPHTPPTPGRSLTVSALEHHAQQSALGMPTFDGPSITVTDTDLEHEEAMERERERFERETSGEESSAGWESASTSASERADRRLSSMNGTRYRDAPLTIIIPKLSVSPSPSAAEVPLPLSPVVPSNSAFSTISQEDEDPIEAEINAALASIEQSSSCSSLPSSSSSSSFSSQEGPDRSSIAYFAQNDSPKRAGSPRIPRSRTTSSDLASILSSATTDSEVMTDVDDDSLYAAELGVVMTGQRVSCSYESIGLAK